MRSLKESRSTKGKYQMETSTDDKSKVNVVDEEIWRAWVQKGKLRDQATARRLKLLAEIALVLLALGGAFYFLAVR
jgi:hypothetical protein